MRRALIIVALLANLAAGAAAALETPARAAIVLDVTSGTTLMEKNADAPLPPASMSKLMTLNMVFEALRDGRLGMEDRLPVSEAAWRKGGSKMFVEVGDRIRVADLLRGVTVQSGNDACIVLAEALGGTEAAFAGMMNARAAELGLTNSHFENATGWPGERHYMSVRDLSTLASHIIREFPEYMPLFSIDEFTWEDITQYNRNPLLGLGIGANGMKTGHTQEAGYGLVASVEREGRKVVAVVAGLETPRQRAVEAEKLVNWAYREFRTGRLFAADQAVAEAEVWIGAQERVGLAPREDVVVTVPFSAADQVRARLHYEGPVPAPITAGQEIGELIVEAPDMAPMRHPLVAMRDVAEGGALARVEAGAALLLRRLPLPGRPE